MIIPFCGPTYNAISPNLNCSRSVNLYPEIAPEGSKSQLAMLGTPGTALMASIGKNLIRGALPFNGLLYVVSGNSLYSVSGSAVISASLGTLTTSVGRVAMKHNGLGVSGAGGNQLMITDGVNGYIYNVLIGSFVTLNNPALETVAGSVTTGTFINQETVKQQVSNATAIVANGSVPVVGPMTITNVIGSPDGSHTWTGQTSNATFAPTGAPTAAAATSFPGSPVTLEYLDGYFLVSVAGSMVVYASNLFDGTTWSPLAFSPVMGAPDTVQTVFNYSQQLWIIKQYTTEVWYDTGTAPSVGFPFSRESGAVIDYGTSAPWSAARGANSLFFLATGRENEGGELVGVVQISGYTPQVVSPPAIVYQWSQYSVSSDAFGYCYSDGGHTFYVLTFPSANATWVYDAATKMWHERSTWTGSPYAIGRHVGNCYAYFNGMHLVGDYQNGNIYRMAQGIYQDNGLPLVSMRTAQVLWDKNTGDPVSVLRLTVDCEMGVGGGATLAWSKDGGHTFGSEHPGSMGQSGQYSGRLVWRKLGVFKYGFIPRITISDPVKRRIFGAIAEVDS